VRGSRVAVLGLLAGCVLVSVPAARPVSASEPATLVLPQPVATPARPGPLPMPEVEPARPGPLPMPEVEPARPGPVPMPEVEPARPGPVPMPEVERPGVPLPGLRPGRR